MRRLFWWFLELILLGSAVHVHGVNGPVTIRLLEKAATIGPGITVAEVAEISGENKVLLERIRRLVVSRAAPPGEVATLTQSYLKIALRREGYSAGDVFVEGSERAEVLSESQELDPEDLLPQAKEFILGGLKEAPDNVDLKLLGLGKKIPLPAGKMEAHFKLPPTTDKYEGPVLLNVELDVNGHWVKSLPLRLMVEVSRLAVTTKESVDKGEKFTVENVAVTRVPSSQLTGQCFKRLDDVLGRSAAGYLIKGAVVKLDCLYDPPVIKRGQIVQGIVQYGNVEISVQVRAVEDGKPGGSIRVENIDTNKLLRGKVLDDKSVLIEREQP